MTILKIWKTSPLLLAEKSVKQIVAIAGAGKLLDDSEASHEFRALLAELPSSLLIRYADECLREGFTDSGMALPDLINEGGRRLGFEVSNGRYRGKQGSIGNDGLWTLPNGHRLIVEVKTTDAFRIDLNIISEYRRQLIRDGHASEDGSSALIVVGRTDTGDLEAQIRGSRSAWDMRLISIDALMRLMALKESVEDPDALRRIYEILVPREFTKLDAIVDLVFSTAEDAKEVDELPLQDKILDPSASGEGLTGPKFTPVAFNDLIAVQVSDRLTVPLLKRTRATFSSPDDGTRVVCMASREYKQTDAKNYWFAFHPHQKTLLEQAHAGYAAFGCGSANQIILIPIAQLATWLDGLNQTVKVDSMYWHIQIYESDGGRFVLARKKGLSRIDLSPYLIRSPRSGVLGRG